MSTPTTLLQAHWAIEAILAALPDAVLPKPETIELAEDGDRADPNLRIAWFNDIGYHLGSSRRGGSPNPGGSYRERGAWDAIVGEALRRLDLRHHEEPVHPQVGTVPAPWESRETDRARITELEQAAALALETLAWDRPYDTRIDAAREALTKVLG